jgi:hypothetical protein
VPAGVREVACPDRCGRGAGGLDRAEQKLDHARTSLCTMFGLSFACVLTLIVRPVLYAVMDHVPAKGLPAATPP